MTIIDVNKLTKEDVIKNIAQLKKDLQNDIVILGHHYQSDDVIQFADLRGDSLKLAKDASQLTKKYIVFCGVHFMAETADILTSDEQNIILPDLKAGCQMADMANIEQVEKAWQRIKKVTTAITIPVTYVNCTAKLKAFVGKHEGTICTSSNAKQVINWALNKGGKLFFFPDQHLGRNTAYQLGIKLEEMITYNPHIPDGGVTDEQIKKAKVILWFGYCGVHQAFQLHHIHQLRKIKPNTKIIVHPECCFDVVQASDLNGSTSYIIEQLQNAESGSRFAVGTEVNLVNRLRDAMPDKEIFSLAPCTCQCETMYRIRPERLLNSLLAIKNKKVTNVIKVEKETAYFAKIALERMLTI